MRLVLISDQPDRKIYISQIERVTFQPAGVDHFIFYLEQIIHGEWNDS